MHFCMTNTPKNMLLSLHVVALIIACASASQKHHKVRHKHNFPGLRGRDMNEIREAFYEYRSSQKRKDYRKREYYDDGIDNNLNFSEEIFKKLLTSSTERSRRLPVQFFDRRKRVFTKKPTTTTPKSTDDEDEYFEQGETANRRPNDEAQERFNRDSSYNENQLADGETLTDYKWKTLGTLDGVGNSFQQAQNRELKDKSHHVNRNYEHLRIHGMCRWPTRKVISMPRTALKRYSPIGYVIHLCSDDTACCMTPEKTCVAKKFEEIEMWFHVKNIQTMRDSVESIKVINHTECDCVYKNQRTTRLPIPFWPVPTTPRTPRCDCPSHFFAEVDEDGVCGCNCTGIECKTRYDGEEGFNIGDRISISNGKMVQPMCHHGTYIESSGRCPSKNDKINKSFPETKSRRR